MAIQFPPRLSYEVDVRGDDVHLIVSGELDHRTSDEFELAVRGVLTGCPGALVVDLSAVELISAEGASALVDVVHRAVQVCPSVAIVPSRAVRQRLSLLGLAQSLISEDTDPATGQTPPGLSA